MFSQILDDVKKRITEKENDETLFIGIAGIPGSGKSTLGMKLEKELGNDSIYIPMDGFHYTRKELDSFPDPENAHLRRGAHFTFNSKLFIEKLTLAKRQSNNNNNNNAIVDFPGFSHEEKDPVEGKYHFNPSVHSIFICEGNYLALDHENWNDLEEIFNVIYFIPCDLELAMDRVKKRLIEEIGFTKEVAAHRLKENDLKNANFILENKRNSKKIVVL